MAVKAVRQYTHVLLVKYDWRQGRASGCAEGKGSELYVYTAVEIILAFRLTSTF